jgi:hypothetical protein
MTFGYELRLQRFHKVPSSSSRRRYCFLARISAVAHPQVPLGSPAAFFVLLAHISGSAAKAAFRVSPGFLDPTIKLSHGETMLSGHFNRCWLALEDINHQRLAVQRLAGASSFIRLS